MLFLFLLVALSGDDNPPPGEMIDVGGFRLHIQIQGKGRPTVVFLAGSGDWSSYWSLVQPVVAKEAGTASYDSQGRGWSEFGPPDRSLHQEAYELKELLSRAGLPGPYVLVGHSLGGMTAHMFAVHWPELVRGIVYVDASTPDLHLKFREEGKMVWRPYHEKAKDKPIPPLAKQRLQAPETRSINHPRDPGDLSMFPPEVQAHFRYFYAQPMVFAKGQKDWVPNEFKDMLARPKAYKLGDLPIRVISGDDPNRYAGDSHEAQRKSRHDRAVQWLLAQSTQSRLVSAPLSGHHIHLDQPDLVIQTIKELLASLDN